MAGEADLSRWSAKSLRPVQQVVRIPGINKAHSEGWEGQIAWSPVAGLTLGGDATLTSAVIDSNNPFAAAFKGDHLRSRRTGTLASTPRIRARSRTTGWRA